MIITVAVSYTHLDVYKRQTRHYVEDITKGFMPNHSIAKNSS